MGGVGSLLLSFFFIALFTSLLLHFLLSICLCYVYFDYHISIRSASSSSSVLSLCFFLALFFLFSLNPLFLSLCFLFPIQLISLSLRILICISYTSSRLFLLPLSLLHALSLSLSGSLALYFFRI